MRKRFNDLAIYGHWLILARSVIKVWENKGLSKRFAIRGWIIGLGDHWWTVLLRSFSSETSLVILLRIVLDDDACIHVKFRHE